MNALEKNWNNLFGEYTIDETAWYGCWTVYSPNQEVMKTQQAIRSFRSNSDNTVITHINRYFDANENIEEKTWQIDRETCNQPDGVIHPAMSLMRALSFGAGATAWISQKFIPGKPFGVEFFFRDHNWRSSAAIIYGENGKLNRIVHIREHLGCFSDELASLQSSEISGNWVGKKLSIAPDLTVSPEEDIQISFSQISGDKMISLAGGMIIMFPERVNIEQPIQIAALQRTVDHQLKYLTAQYNAVGVFTLLISATLQQNI
ncbi:MAG: DUF3598 family protein [Fischerella sp. CENA71]|nr:DUF3598 family protein [Fischerella sp. CENA71]